MLFGMHLFVIIYEESALERKFGDSYLRYRQVVPRWLPRLKRNGPQGQKTS
jgi:protein-S-isoprenylcysteine O-methyltransferase Ste14